MPLFVVAMVKTIQMIAMLELQVSQNGLKVNAIKVQNFTF
jgi:hypothetical protein